jgi:hypothetical protein
MSGIGRWEGTYKRDQATWLRFYTPEGQLILTPDELAEVAEQRANAAEQRADVAEAEVARLRAELARQHGESHA